MFTRSAGVLTADLAESSTTQVSYANPATAGVETVLAGVLADVVHVERVQGSNFFDDVGADSLVMAGLSPGQEAGDLPPVSMKHIYRHPTISSLAISMQPSGLPGRRTAARSP